MAIYHCHASMVSRGKGRSVIAAAAYIAGAKMYDEHQQMTHNYDRKRGVEHIEIMAPDGAPSWVYDRDKLWNAVDAAEKRVNSQTAREVRVALPVELSDSQQVDVLRAFVKESFVENGMVAEFAVHRDNPDNPHAHILLTTRAITPNGFSHKERSWNDRDLYVQWRGDWAHQCNRGLARAGIDVHIDHRSYAEQGIDLEPTKHLGIQVEQAKTEIPSTPIEQKEARQKDKSPKHGRWDGRLWVRDAADEHEQILARNGDRVLQRPETALDALARSQATFTRRDMASYLASHMDAERAAVALEKVVNCEHAMFVGRDHEGTDRFTTKRHMETEVETLRAATELASRSTHQVSQQNAREPSLSRRMGREQEAAYRYLTQESGDIAVVQGYAGAGKTYLLGAAKEAWEAQGFRVIGAALAAKAAQGLEVESGIQSRTIASTLRSLDGPKSVDPDVGRVLNAKTVLVIDEAGMAGTYDLHRLLGHAEVAGCKVVLTGDVEQLQAVEAGAMMRAISERVGEVVVSEIRRQKKENWQRDATRMMGRGETKDALHLYEQHGHFVGAATKTEAIESMLRAWREAMVAEPDDSLLMLAHERADVAALNAGAREVLVEAGQLESGVQHKTAGGNRFFARGDRLVFTKNDRELAVKNGQTGTVEATSGQSIVVKLHDDAREVRIDVSRYRHFDHGYAVTVHKAQGETVDRSFVLASRHFDSNLSYVAMSRHAEDVRLFWSEEVFGSKEALIDRLSRVPSRSTALDYVLAHDLQDGVQRSPFGVASDEPSVEEQRAEFIRDVDALSDAELEDWRERLAPHAERELVKPADMAAPAEAERLEKLSEELDQAHERWWDASAPYYALRKEFIAERTDPKPKDSTPQEQTSRVAMSKAEAEGLWETQGRHSTEARQAFLNMVPAFDARDKAIADLQRHQQRSRVAQKAAEAAREHNFDVRRSRDMLHLVEREIEQRRIAQLQGELDATEFNLTQRLRMWNDATQNMGTNAALRAYANDGPLKELWADLRVDERLASSARYELSGMVATRGAWFAPLEGLGVAELPTDRHGLGQEVDAARQSYQEAMQRWGLWRAEHAVAEAHAARRGEGEGADAYRDYVIAERTHGRAQRAYMDRVVRDEIGRTEGTHLEAAKAWEAYREAHPEKARDAYKGEGEAGRLWKAERQSYDELSRWQSQYDWRNGRGRHHIFPQPESAGTRQGLRHREAYALQLGAEWEAYKGTCSAEQLEEARLGKGEGGELYEQYRIAHRERQHARHELRITSTEQELRRTEHQCLRAHGELLVHLKELPTIELAVGDHGRQGALWRKHQELDAQRQDLELRLDKLLRIERSFDRLETPTGQELLDQWRAAETAVAETSKAWQSTQAGGDSLQARRRVGNGASVYDAYREALARRDALRLPVVRAIRILQLDGAESHQLEVLARAATESGHDRRADELYNANHERLRCQALLDEVAPWPPVHLHPQPEATAERIQTIQARFETALRDWVEYKDAHGQDAVLQVYKGEADERGIAVFDTYRQASIEYQHVQWEMRAERMQAKLDRVERDCADVHRELFGRLTNSDAVTRAMTERGEEGALWRRRGQLEAERRELDLELGSLLGIRWPSEASELAASLPQDAEFGRQWHAAEEAVTAAAAAWAQVPQTERRQARAGWGEHAEVYEAYRAAVDRRDVFRGPMVRGVRGHELELAKERHREATRLLAVSAGEKDCRKAEQEAKSERERLEALLEKTASAHERVAGPDAEARALAPSEQAEAPEWEVGQRHWLSVPYTEREQAKASGARWSEEARCWYAPAGADLSALSRWVGRADERSPQQQFADVLQSAGLVVEGEPIMDGQFHRVAVEGAKRGARDGAYIGHLSGDGERTGLAYGYCKNHRTGEERRWNALGTRPLSREQRAQIAEKQKETGLERDLRHWRRAAELKELWRHLPDAQHDHPYLANKGVGCHGLKQDERGALVMPLRDADGEMWSLQSIDADGAKRLATGGRKSGCFHLIGELQGADEILICEGYATGASLHRATEKPVVVAIDAGNLKPVAEAIRQRHPGAQIALMADNDHHRQPNVGVEKATEAARAADGVVVVPRLTETERSQGLTDWNDIHSARGLAGLESELRGHFDELKQESARTPSEPADQVGQSKERPVEAHSVSRTEELEEMWKKLASARQAHPYLVNKRVPAHDLKEAQDGSLVMALRDVDGRIRSVQPASAQDTKERIVGDPQNAGCFHAIGEMRGAKEIMICEGYASGATLHLVTLTPVAVAVDAENLQPVAEALRERYPGARLVIAADNDHHRQPNVGIEKATEAARTVEGVVVAPKFDPFERVAGLTNWNDLYDARGIDGVKDELDRQLDPNLEKDQQRAAEQDRSKGDWEITR